MVREILSAAGVEFAQGRFIRMPEGTHAVYFDDIEVTGSDRLESPTEAGPRIYHHNVTIDVYEPMADDQTENAIEQELDARGLDWTKQDRYWIKDLQRYQTVYELTYTSKSK